MTESEPESELNLPPLPPFPTLPAQFNERGKWARWATEYGCLCAQAERKRCAKLCDEYTKNSSSPMSFAENCAAAIRQRKP